MRLRTVTGTRWPAFCACGCHTRIEPSTTAKVVVDFDAHPRKTWIPEHSPDAGTWRKDPPKQEASASQQGEFQPASALPARQEAPPKAPELPAPPKAPAPAPIALLGSVGASDSSLPTRPGGSVGADLPRAESSLGTPSLLSLGGEASPSPNPAAGVPWATASLTFNAGSFESARAGLADYAQPGESCEQLRARVNRLVLEDLERSVRAMRELHERLGDTPIRTSSPARAAGAPSGALAVSPSPPPLSASASVTPPGPGTAGGEGAPARPRGPGDRGETVPTTADLVRRVQLDLTDISVRRKRAKENATQRMLELRGLRSLRECGSADESALSALLATFEEIDTWDTQEARGAAPTLDPRLVIPA